jgi:hypothetical protein
MAQSTTAQQQHREAGPFLASRAVGANLLKPEWAAVESDELRTLLGSRYGEPGQTSGLPVDDGFYLPLAGPTCRVVLRFKDTRISSVEPGPRRAEG